MAIKQSSKLNYKMIEKTSRKLNKLPYVRYDSLIKKPKNLYVNYLKGKDVFTRAKISVTEAVLGAKRKIPTVDGDVVIKIPSGTATGKQLRIKEQGVQITDNRRGDLYVELVIDVPTKLTKQQKKLLEELQKTGL